MKLAELFKKQPSLYELRRDLRAAVGAGQISVRMPVIDALQRMYGLDSLDRVEMEMAIEEQGDQVARAFTTVWDLLCVLDRKHENDKEKHIRQSLQ